jgi:hypothetical protein
MVIPGRVKNGVVVFEGSSPLPEGAAVTIAYPAVPPSTQTPEEQRIQVPLVRTGEPGTMHLTNDRIAEILDQEDAAPRH